MKKDYPVINNIEDIPYTKALRDKIKHAEKYQKKELNDLKKQLSEWISIPLIKLK